MLDESSQLCLHCIFELPITGFADMKDNPVEKIFWGRIHVEAATSELYFSKGTLVQSIIHQLKYKGNREAGIMLGKIMGESLSNSNRFKEIDLLIPLPLTRIKERKRGYNQSEILCLGISEVTNIPILKNAVSRLKATETQTKKRRSQRWDNVEGNFFVNQKELIQGKHVLLVDDVITTGATLEACGQEILHIAGTRLSIAALAWATR